MLRTILKYLVKMIKREIPLIDGWYYIQGHYREWCYYKARFLMRKFIREQIEFRMVNIDSKCWNDGQCKLCGCAVPALTMCDKECHKPCYPPMMNKSQWQIWKAYNFIELKGKLWHIDLKTNKLDYVESNKL